jgi:IMP and pyridine-specific 5'-nucleotidase
MCQEWIKALLVVPFVIYSQPTGVYDSQNRSVSTASTEAHRRYAEILKDVEQMIDDHSTLGN